MMTANITLRPASVERRSGRIATSSGQLPVAHDNEMSPEQHQGDATTATYTSGMSRSEDGTSDDNAVEFGTSSDSEEETIVSDEGQADNLRQQLNAKLQCNIYESDKPHVSGQGDKPSAAEMPPAFIGEIRRMFQAELDAFRAVVRSEQYQTHPRQSPEVAPEAIHVASTSPNTHTQPNPSAAPYSPTQNNARLKPELPGCRLERSFSMGARPTNAEREIFVRFAEEEKRAAARQADKLSSPSKSTLQLSPIDQKWGQLFDDRGHATKRLEQVLRGLATYIIDEFIPQKSIVIPPDKLAAFYSHHKVENEAHDFISIFKCRTKGWSVAMEDVYQDLGCEYYLIPKDAHSRPSIPSLTPAGFAKWMTSSILAYPDAEAKRLNHIVSELPINADGPWDGITERLPKQISRHLFPEKPDRRVRRLFDDALRDFADELILASSKQMPTRPQQQQQQPPPRIEISQEKRHSTSGGTSAAAAIPRTARYVPEQPRSRANSASYPPPAASMRLGRAYSDDHARPPPVLHSRKRDSEPAPPPLLVRTPSSASARRRSSPAMEAPHRRSAGDVARAKSPVVVAARGRGEEERDGEYQHYVHARRDYTPRGTAGDRETPRRVAVVQDGVGGNPGPTWDEYLNGRQTVYRGNTFGRGHKASI